MSKQAKLTELTVVQRRDLMHLPVQRGGKEEYYARKLKDLIKFKDDEIVSTDQNKQTIKLSVQSYDLSKYEEYLKYALGLADLNKTLPASLFDLWAAYFPEDFEALEKEFNS